jgi:hypothetical protein
MWEFFGERIELEPWEADEPDKISAGGIHTVVSVPSEAFAKSMEEISNTRAPVGSFLLRRSWGWFKAKP